MQAILAPAPVEPVMKRLRRRGADRAVLANPPVAAAFCLLRALGLIAPLPYWLLVLVVFVGGAIAVISSALWGDDRRTWHLPIYVGVNMGVITVVAYATGWGPILSIGFIFGAGAAMQLYGSRSTRPNLGWTVVWMTLGQTAIALGIAPTLIRQPLVHGLALLSLLGTLVTISLLHRVTVAREEIESALRQSERRFKALVSNAADVIIVVDEVGRLQYVSPAFERILGLSPEPFYEQSIETFVHPEDLARLNVEMAGMYSAPDQALVTRLRIRDAGGNWKHFEASISDRMNDPDVGGIVGNLHDITELLEAVERFRSAFEDAPIGMALAGLDGMILRTNRAYGSILGRTPESLVGTNIKDFTHPDDWEHNAAEMHRVADGSSGHYDLEKRYIHRDGHVVWGSAHVTCVYDSAGRPQYLIGQVQDITEQHDMRQHLAHAAIHDPLTGLPNRVLFLDRLNMALSRSERSGRRVAVAFLDLDRFKLVNDGLGHAAGDELLQAVAGRLRESLRGENTVARLGGDEFTILFEDIDEESQVLTVAERILAELQRPFELDGSPVFVTASIGVVSADGSASSTGMLRDADTAMYLAKEAGRNRVEVFNDQSHTMALEALHVINELHTALAREEFRLHYQPIVDVATGHVVATEALVRWQHPGRGLVSPDQFIPLAEDCGVIVQLGAWVLRSACEQTASWNNTARMLGIDPIEVHVNVSPRQLTSPDFVDLVAATLAGAGIAPGVLCLEVTETTLMSDQQASAQVLHSLRALGVRISVDDFGTGYSSLAYLKRFPIDSLKVDRSFVDGLGEEAEDSVIVSAIIALAHSLGLSAVAEGVETEIALEELRRLECDRAQGYLLGYPQPPECLHAVLFESRMIPARSPGVSLAPTATRPGAQLTRS